MRSFVCSPGSAASTVQPGTGWRRIGSVSKLCWGKPNLSAVGRSSLTGRPSTTQPVVVNRALNTVRGTRLVVQSLCDFRLMGRGPL